MSSEVEFFINIWETVRDNVPTSKRNDLAKTLLRHFSEYGFTIDDLSDIVDEDPDLTKAFEEVFEEESDENNFDDDDYTNESEYE